MYVLSISQVDETFAESVWLEAQALGIEVSGVEINEEPEAKVLAYIESKSQADALATHLTKLKTDIVTTVSKIENQNWNQNWEDHFDQFEAGPWSIKNSERYGYSSKNKFDIYLQPSPSFGFGSHESTRLMLGAMAQAQNIFKDSRVLDFGSGTGILSIAAKKLGAKEVAGIEIDSDSLAYSKKQVELNKSPVDFKATINSDDIVFNVLLMNVLLPVHQDHLSNILKHHMNQNCHLILAGFLKKTKPMLSQS